MARRARSRRALISLLALLGVVAACLSAVTFSRLASPPGRQLPHGTSMATLAPRLLAKPGDDPVTGSARQPACAPSRLPAAGEALAAPGRSTLVSHDGATVQVTGKAVRKGTRITAQSLCAASMAKLDQGMTNVTAGPRRGYRFLPHMNFGAALRITLPYDPSLIPAGMSPRDIGVYYYDVTLRRWQALPQASVDTKAMTVTSTTTHFTDFAAATLMTPDAPGVMSDDPTTIKNIKAADPGANENLIAPPVAANDGDAHLSYPLELPKGRNGAAPSLTVGYDSGGGDGWMGLGWNLELPSVEVSTQWGVPRYDAAAETESYLLSGSELTPVANRGTPVARTADKTFHTRVEGSFSKITRHGDSPKDYWWEVTDKNGSRSFYGGDPENGPDPAAELTDGSGNVFRWALTETEDLNGNTVHYTYAHVSDPGIPGGTVNGTNLYPASINYTGTGDAAGAYTVTFTRDRDLPGYTRRPDVSMTAKGGFLLVTADLLKHVDITFNGQEVRGYQFDYTTGAFGKTLLQSVTQLGTDGGVFNRHTFAYYDDAQDSSGNYNGFSPATTVSTGSDNVTAGLLGQGEASALSGNETTSTGGDLYAGFNPVSPSKEGSAGAKVGFTSSSSDGVLALVDLNGDNKPDKVFESGGKAYIRLNTTSPGGPVTFSAQADPLPTLPAISHATSESYSSGAEAYLGANVFTNTSQDSTTSDTYFQDVNGDGLTDLVSDGQVLFNHLDSSGIPTFTANSADTPVPVGGGTVDTSGIGTAPLSQQASAADPLIDSVRTWTAPYAGTVAITGDVTLTGGGTPAQGATADGVRVAIQRGGTELWNTVIPPDDTSPHTPAGVSAVPVSAGDRLYFRSQSVSDGSGDQVSWDPVITYQGLPPATDVNGRDLYTYQASKDFTLAGRTGAVAQAPFTGTVHVAGTFHKAAATTDDVTVQVLRNGTAVFSQTVPASQSGDTDVSQDIDVTKGDTIALREKIDSPVDVTQLSWNPQLYYTSAPGQTVTGSDGKPLITMDAPVDTDLYPADDLGGAVQQSWTAPSSGTIHVTPRLSAAAGASGTVTFTVKRPGALLGKETVSVSGGTAAAGSLDVPVSAGDQLYFDFSAADPALGGQVTSESAQAAYDGQDPVTVPSALHYATAPGILPEAYRGWSYAAYNGDGGRATQPIAESDLTQTFTSGSAYDPRTAKAYPMTPSSAAGEWAGPSSGVYLKAGQASSSRLGAPSLAVPSPSDFAGARAPSKVSDSSQTAVGGGVSLLSGSVSSGTSASDVDYLDMNGSGYPAVVSDGHIQYPSQTGALAPASVAVPGLGAPRSGTDTSANVGVGGTAAHFTSNSQGKVDNAGSAPSNNTNGSQDVPLGLSASLGSGQSHPDSDLIDLNGDGLPDIVTRDGNQLKVSLNLGYSFAPPETYGTAELGDGASENGTIGATLGFNDGLYGTAGGISLSKNKSESDEELISLTGSGLPDRVINTPSGLQVAFNTGTGFAAPVPFPGAPAGACADSTSLGATGIDWNTTRLCNGDTSQGAGAYFTIGIPLCTAACYIILNPGADTSQSMNREEGALRDVTGNGVPDYVSSTSDGQLTVSMNDIGRTNLLKSVSRPLGATITMDYQRTGNTYQQPQQRWVMSRVTVDPGAPGAGGEPTAQTSYEYSGGTYNRLERTFYGFATVTEHDLDTAHGDAVYRSFVRDFDTTSYYTRGLLLRTRLYDASGNLYTDTQQTYDTRDVGTGADPADTTSTTATIFPMLVRSDVRYFEGGATAQKSTYTVEHYDAVGNVDQQTDAGDAGTGDDVVTSTSFSSCPGTYLSAPVTFFVRDVNGNVLQHREQTVDCGTGDITQTRQYLADGTSANTDMTYFPDGELETVTDPPNASGQRFRLAYTYDPAVGTYIASITDSFGLTSATTTDPRFGTPLTATDENGQVTSYTYDEFGRPTTVTGPFQQGTGTATITLEYHPDDAIPWAMTRNADVYRGPGATIDTVTFIDGLKRTIQTKKSATVFTGAGSAPQDVMTVSGHVTFDPFGRTVTTSYPVTEPLGTPGTYNATVDPVAPTTGTFDVLDRNTSTTLPDGSATTTAFGFGPDRSGTTEFTTTVTNANNQKTITYHDIRQLLTSQEQFHNGTPIWTSYAYDPLKELTSVTDDQGKVTTSRYDLLGRKTDVTSPDSGDTQTVYDLAGNAVATITPNLRAKGKQITDGYDYNRLVSVTYPDNPGDDVTYTYGAPGASGNGAGRVIQTTDASGTTQDSYDALGNVIYEARTVNTTVGATQPTYVTQFTYDTFDRVQSMIYPDGETLTYRYDSGGLVSQVTGVKGPNSYTYVSSEQYDKFGAKVYIGYGNGVTSKWSYDPLTRRVATAESAPAGGSDFQDMSYTYDKMGNVTAIANNIAIAPNGGYGGPTTQQFGYDDLDRLTSASGTYDFAPKKENDYSLSMSYDSVSDITEKNQANWTIQPSGKEMVGKNTYDSTYAYGGAQEHAPSHVGDTAYSYDADGNTTGTAAGSSGQNMTLTWSDADQLTSLSNNGMTTSYVYDASGERAMKRVSQGETVYVNQYFTIRNGEIGTKQVIVGDTLVAEQMTDHDDTVYEDNQYFFQGDQISSANYVTDATGSVFEHTEYLPTGEIWEQDASNTHNIPFGFASEETDPESGFSYMGARYYNPVTGIFISPDPALPGKLQGVNTSSSPDTFAPGFLNLYNYADDQPLTKTDPTGMAPPAFPIPPGTAPLTSGKLYEVARQRGINTLFPDPNRFILEVGLRFQFLANQRLRLNGLPIPENRSGFLTFARGEANIVNGEFPPSFTVVPDIVQGVEKIDSEGGFTYFPGSSFIEVKTGTATITLASYRRQILGLIDALANSDAAEDTGPGHVSPLLIFVTPTDKEVAGDVIDEAQDRGVQLFQIGAYLTPNGQIGFTAAVPLNRMATQATARGAVLAIGLTNSLPGDLPVNIPPGFGRFGE